MKNLIILFTAMLVFAVPQLAVAEGEPEWFAGFLSYFTEQGGCWHADNTPHKSEQEPWAAYRVDWSYTIGESGKRAVLYGVDGEAQSDPFWEIRVFWDGKLKQVRVLQQGQHGIVGTGLLKQSGENEYNQELVFALPDGRSWGDRHKIVVNGATHETTSYQQDGEQWKENRSYVWGRCE